MGSTAEKVSNLSCTTTATATATSSGSSSTAAALPEDFPVGMSVLVVDDDLQCLRILEHMLLKCSYRVTTSRQATDALSMLRERKGCFDVVITDVHMPDMDGFKLLELVGPEMDLPVILMSGDGRTSAVMKAIEHGACDYLIKPVRMEELQNIWQHVIRKKWNGIRDTEQSAGLGTSDQHKQGGDDIKHASSANERADGNWKIQKKRKDAREEENEEDLDNDDQSSKKPRVVWSVELHQQFVTAVNQLGIEKAVPKRILELMNVPGLTRENVASHLQKFRLYLRRISGVAQQQTGVPILGGLDIQAFAASGQVPPQTLAALHAQLFDRPVGSTALPAIDKSPILQASLQGAKGPVECDVAFGQPIANCPTHVSKQFPHSRVPVEDIHRGFGTWLPNSVNTMASLGNPGVSNTPNNMLKLLQPQLHQSVLSEPNHAVNVQPSCVVASSQSPNNGNLRNISFPFSQSPTFSASNLLNHNFISPQSHKALGLGQASDVNLRNKGVLDGYNVPVSVSSLQPFSGRADNVSHLQVQSSTMNSNVATRLHGANIWGGQGVYTSNRSDSSDQEVSAGNGAILPSRFAPEGFESMDNLRHGRTYGENNRVGVKQELNLDFIENPSIFS